MRKRLAWLAVSLMAALVLILPVLGEDDGYIRISAFDDAPEVVSEAPDSAQLVDDAEGWPRVYVVTAGGDCTIGCTESQRTRKDGFARVVADKGYAWPFSGILEYTQADDLTLVNFEGTLTDAVDRVEKLFNFKGPPEYAQILTLGSVEAVNLANNHFHDYGEQGKADTLATLEASGIVHCGPGWTAIYESRGVRVGLIGNTFPYSGGKRDISEDVKALRAAGCQIVIASFHWGSEYEADYTRDQRNIGRAAIDAGADVVIGHHPHIVQGIERYKDRYILYSLGNLVFGGNTSPSDKDSYLAQLRFEVYEDSSAAPKLTIVPVRLSGEKSGTDYRPIPAQGSVAERIVERILRKSSNLGDYKGSE